MNPKYVLGVDIGGFEIKFGVVECKNSDFKILKSWKIKTLPGKENVDKMFDIIHQNIEYAKKFSICSCGIGVAGMIDNKKGVVIMAPNLKWEKIEIKKILTKRCNLPIVVENDANATALGIYYTKILKKYPKIKNLICFTLGTGVGGGIIINGEILHGEKTSAAELGHIVLEPKSKKQCGCGNYGCLERYVGAKWFIENIKETIKTQKVSSLLLDILKGDLSKLTTEVLYQAALKRDEFALQQWRLFGEYLGIAISSLINIFNPEIIVFTGGVSEAYRFFLPYIKKEVEKRVWPKIDKDYSLSKNIKYHIEPPSKNLGILGVAIVTYKTFLL